jgi:16S rRNA (cytidine1402-2'-O)-methyltransferase
LFQPACCVSRLDTVVLRYAREVTKLHEEFLRGLAASVFEEVKGRGELKGEITLLIGKAEEQPGAVSTQPRNIRRRLNDIMTADNLDEKSALKVVAKELGISKSEAYRELQRTK